MENVIEIMFYDVSEEKQRELLDAIGCSTAEEMNWDVIPIAVVPIESDTE